ncbi:MAG: hypothetical protein NTY65_17055 [Planctomycetota bacterium]|nr:hypothetical protein [Planctomycetota bacterium]
MRNFINLWILGAAFFASLLGGVAASQAADNAFHPKNATVWDELHHKFVWRDACGNNYDDHQVTGGFEWEGDSRDFIALGEGWVRKQRRGGLFMLSFPDGNKLSASWPVELPKGHVWRLRYALTDEAAAKTRDGLKFTVVAADAAGNPHTLVDRVLKPRDQRIYEEEIRFEFDVRKITFVHDNLGSEVWDVLWILPDGLVIPRTGGPAVPNPGLTALRQAIEDLCGTFPRDYPRGPEFLARLDRIQKGMADANPGDAAGLAAEFEALRREALIANPLVSGQPIVYVVRPPYRSHYHAIDTLFHTGEFNADRNEPHVNLFKGGAALKVIDLARGSAAKTLVDAPQGIARDPEVHFNGRKIVFSLRRNVGEDYHIWEVNADGSGLKQLTFAAGVSDFDPLYLADDTIVFASTREPKFNQCSRDHGANLFRMDADGANIHQIERNNLFDNQPSVMPDGRILYARWEYVDRNFGDAHSLWTMWPDGTNQAIYWGNNTAVPGAVYTARIIPGTDRAVCIFGPHHDHLWGAMAIVDPSLGLDGREPIVRLWPPEAVNMVRTGGAFDCDSFSSVRLKFADPYPLADPETEQGAGKYFLCSRMTGRGDQMGIYLVDVFGNELLLHAEGPGCYDPMPLGPRQRPPVLPSRRDFEDKEGFFYVVDVYEGTHMKGVERGSVKRLRIVEAPEKRFWSKGAWFGQGYTAPGMNWHSLENKRILGSVPVEEDGSAYFAVPSDRFVYFQLLDENGMMVQSMRSGTMVQSGERAGCIGCHDERRTAAPAARDQPLAFRRAPSRIENWYGPPREFGFMAEVQPVLSRRCLPCHDYGQEGGKKLVLAPDRDLTFNAAYNELWRKGCTSAVGAGPAEIQQARSWGSHASKLVQALRKEHYDVKLSREEFDRIATWVDLNAPYYPTYASAYPNNFTGRCPLDDGQLQRLAALTGVAFTQFNSFSSNRGPQVSFDRPELSPCLAKLRGANDAKYREALAIIQSGKEQLARRPREDMDGSQFSDADRQREEKYVARRAAELRSREAIRNAAKVYDASPVSPGRASGDGV